MDIAHVAYKGLAIGYISKTGIVSPAFYEAPGTGFLRNFFAGLLPHADLLIMEAGLLDFVEPGGKRNFDIEIGVLYGAEEIVQFMKVI